MLAFRWCSKRTLTLENLSRPPSVSLSFLIHSCVLENRRLSESWKGDSQGSSLTTPSTRQYVWGVEIQTCFQEKHTGAILGDVAVSNLAAAIGKRIGRVLGDGIHVEQQIPLQRPFREKQKGSKLDRREDADPDHVQRRLQKSPEKRRTALPHKLMKLTVLE